MRATRHASALMLLAAALPAAAAAAELPAFDFKRPGSAADWLPTHDVAAVEATPDGLAITLTGDDPYVTGPARDYPADLPLRMTLVVKPAADGMMQVFHFRKHAREEESVGFPVRAGVWNTVRVMLPALGPGVRLRIDPPGRAGTALIEKIEFEPAASLPAPTGPATQSSTQPAQPGSSRGRSRSRWRPKASPSRSTACGRRPRTPGR